MSLLAENTKRWKAMKIKPSFWPAAQKFAKRALVHKAEYQAIADTIKNTTGKHIPWWFIPLVHERECIRGVDNWTCNLGQGSPFNQKSKIKPYNGPFHSFREAAIAALIHEAPHAASNTNWSGGGTMTIGEAYNGIGYARKGLPSPYVWSGTNQYVKGKYVKDGVFNPNTVDTQLGIAISLKAMMELDPSIMVDGDMPGQENTPRKAETATSVGLFASVLAFINTNPYFVFTWFDVSMIMVGTVIGLAAIIYIINEHKKRQV